MCTGQTDEGCSLAWRDVPTEEGTVVPQCVQFCPQTVQPQPVSVVQAPPTPVQSAGGCEVRAYTEADLRGETFTTGDSYPDMGDWAQQIVSLQVVAGTWDFYAEDNYGGEAVRLPPGDYPALPEGWANQISSFMCVRSRTASKPRLVISRAR